MSKPLSANGKSSNGKKTNEKDVVQPVTHEQKNAEAKRRDSQTLAVINKDLPAFHQTFSAKLFVIGISILMAAILASLLYYQSYQQSKSVFITDLLPLKKHVEQLQLLQKNKLIVEQLLYARGDNNGLEQHSELVAINRQLLSLKTSHVSTYKQWLTQNVAAKDIVERVQKNQIRNQRLKQSSIIQLQLMLFTTTSLLDKKAINEQNLYQQLKKDSINDNVTQSRVQAYAKLTKQLYVLKRLKIQLAEILSSFKDLSINTTQGDFELLRLNVEEVIAQTKLLKEGNTKTVIELLEQINSFKSIVLTDQSALAKWQGYLRLAQSYHLNLQSQRHQLVTLLSTPQVVPEVSHNDFLSELLVKYNVGLSHDEVILMLTSFTGLLLLIFYYYLWQVRQQLKVTSEESLQLICQSLSHDTTHHVTPNCTETYEVIKKVQLLARPEHNDQDYQALQEQCQISQQLIDEQKKMLAQSALSFDMQELENIEQVAKQTNYELHSYQYLKAQLLQLRLQNHLICLDGGANNATNHVADMNVKESMEGVYETLEQFELASYMHSGDAVLLLEDADFIEVLHSVLLNKQAVFLRGNHQLYMSYDEQIIANTKFDVRLFQFLFDVLFDLILSQSNEAITLQLHIQLKDKKVGQQITRFILNVTGSHLTVLPTAIAALIQPNEDVEINAVLAQVFTLLLKPLYGENIVVQLVDGGYQVSFELPIALASSEVINQYKSTEISKTALAETKVILLSVNKVLSSMIERHVLSYNGKFETLVHMDSFNQIVTPKYLGQHKLDLLIVDSDMAERHLETIEPHIANLPESVKPKMMVLQSSHLSHQQFGFYSQAEQPLCKNHFIANIIDLLTREHGSNVIVPPEHFQQIQYQVSGVTVLLAVRFAQQYHNMQRLLQQLGLKVVMVCSEISQQKHWKTGRYSLLLTEFSQHVFVEMFAEPMASVGVFSLTDYVPSNDDKSNNFYSAWQCDKLSPQSSLSQLAHALSPWLITTDKAQYEPDIVNKNSLNNVLNESLPNDISDDDLEDSELAINEIAACLAPDVNTEASIDFNRFLEHQGSVALALFMLNDYSQDNHQQLASLAKAIKAKEFYQAQEAVKALQLNAHILSSQDLSHQCQQWLDFLSDKKNISEFKQVDRLLKETQQILHAIDSYAETI